MFHDHLHIVVRSGRGGDGGLSFRREKFVPRGGPDGGDGGRGGDVALVADPSLRDLSSLRGRRVFAAGRGGNGRGATEARRRRRLGGARRPGRHAGERRGRRARRRSRATRQQRVVVARGGLGGRGNARFATPTRQTPRFAEIGLPGAELALELRLKLVADAALAGLPNAGKSSLLRRISNATPKVADYPFTTLQPVLGTVESGDGGQLTVADVPGLIEGASEGVGLGHEFLAHLERARLLVHVIDGSEGDADERFATIDRELGLYGAGLDARPQIVVLNKADLSPEQAPFSSDDPRVLEVHRVSCATGEGIAGLKQALFALCPAVARPLRSSPIPSCRSSSTTARPRPSAARIAFSAPIAASASRASRRRRTSSRLALREAGVRPRRARRDRRRGARVAAVTTGVLGGAFDPPHVGHVALARTGSARFGLERLLVRVVAQPGHKDVTTAPEVRLALAQLAFASVGRSRGRPRPLRAHRRLAGGARPRGSRVPRRRGRVRGLPHLEGARPRPFARAARCRDAPGCRSHGARRRSSPGSRDPTA